MSEDLQDATILKLRDVILAFCNLIFSYNCLPSTSGLYEALISHTYILVFNSQDRNKGLGNPTKSQIGQKKLANKSLLS